MATEQKTFQVSASTDDCLRAKTSTPTDTFLTDYADIVVGNHDGINVYKSGGGMRFLNVTIPQGATINSAYLTLRASVAASANTVNSYIRGENANDTSTFSTVANYDGRTRTTANVAWDAIGAWTIDTDYNSPEIKTVIQEIVNRASWASNNSMVIFWDDHDDRSSAGAVYRKVYSYDGSTTYAPKLIVNYSYVPSGGAFLLNMI